MPVVTAITQSARIDGITMGQDGRIIVRFTRGSGALQPGWGGEAMVFKTLDELQMALVAAQKYFAREALTLALLAMVPAFATDATLGALFAALAQGKSSITSLGAPSSVQIGV